MTPHGSSLTPPPHCDWKEHPFLSPLPYAFQTWKPPQPWPPVLPPAAALLIVGPEAFPEEEIKANKIQVAAIDLSHF